MGRAEMVLGGNFWGEVVLGGSSWVVGNASGNVFGWGSWGSGICVRGSVVC